MAGDARFLKWPPGGVDTRDMSARLHSGSEAVLAPPALPSVRRLGLGWGQASRSRRILILLAGVWMLNAFDLGFTLLAHMQGALLELNPIANRLLSYGTEAVIAYKLVVVLFGTSLLWWTRHHRVTEMGTWLVLLAYVALALRWQYFYEVQFLLQQNGAQY